MNPIRTPVAVIFVLFALGASGVTSEPNGRSALDAAESDIRGVIERQTAAWNRGDMETFMRAYQRSDETEFVGANGVTRGWQAVMDRYHQRYPDRKAMGHLSFSNLEVHMVCPDAAYVIGQFQLERESDKPAGVFTLNVRRQAGGWKIVADHTTGFAAASPPASSTASGPTAGTRD